MCAVTHSCKHVRRCYVCDMVHLIHLHPASLLYMTWLIHTKPCVDVICVTWLSHIRTHASPLSVRRGSFYSYKPCVSALYDVIHSCTPIGSLPYVWHDSLRWTRVSLLYMWCNSIMRDMTHSNMWHDSFVFTSGYSGCCHMPLPEELWGALDYIITTIRIFDVVSWSHSMRRFVIGTKTLCNSYSHNYFDPNLFLASWVIRASTSMSHVTHRIESCHAYEWVMSRAWLSSG